MTLKRLFVTWLFLLALAGCAHVDHDGNSHMAAAPEALPPRPELAYVWEPSLSPTGRVNIEIYPNHNRILVYRNGIQIGASTLSAGKEGHDTPPGSYTILQKEIDHRSNLYGSFVSATTGVTIKNDVGHKDVVPVGARFQGASMPYFLRLTQDGVGLHSGYLPGYNASHGCIRLPARFAELLYAETSIGTPVRISNPTLAP